MDAPKKNLTAILYLEKEKATLFMQGAEKAVDIHFPKDIVHNLDILDKEKFTSLLAAIIDKKELKPAHILIVLSIDTTYDKDIQDTPVSLQHIAREEFLGLVPFEEIATKTFRIKNTVKIIAANANVCKALVDFFTENTWVVTGVVPLAVMLLLPDFKDGFDAKTIFKKFDALKQYSLLDFSENTGRGLSYARPQFASLQFILLTSTFVLLLVILGLLLFMRQTGRGLPF